MIISDHRHQALDQRTYIDDGASAGSSGVFGVFQDIFFAETPVTPAEVADFVDAMDIEY